MPITPRRTLRLAAILVALLSIKACASGTSSAKPIPIEIWHGGDDGLTLKLTDAIQSAFRASPDFVLSTGKQPGTLMVTIPTNVPWKLIGNRTQVLYAIDFASAASQNLGTSTGSCWDDALSECADHILKDAKIAAGKIH